MTSTSINMACPASSDRSDGRTEQIVERAREEERWRIARELHDDISPQFTMLTLTVDLIREQSGACDPDMSRRLDEVLLQAREIGRSLREVSHRLHSSTLADLGLAVRSWCQELAAHYDVLFEVVDDCILPSLRGDLALALFRIVQEALQNVLRHSGARHVTIEIAARADAVLLRIADDGCGFDVKSQDATGIGLLSMRERLEPFGGQLTITSAPSRGTRLEASVPISMTRTLAA